MNENNAMEDIKGTVLYHVAKAAFEGNLDQIEATLPYEILPGNKPMYRCCVYKEREIIRERIMLAKNINPANGKPCNNTVVILPTGCENCPITRFSVTDNCQKCMARKCMHACRFDAITMTRDKAYIDPDKCKECGQCYEACPYNAIVDIMRPCRRACPVDAIQASEVDGRVNIDESKCIRCGACIHSCPFSAISDSSRIVEIIEHLRGDRPVYAMVAPAAEGQFGVDITMHPDAVCIFVGPCIAKKSEAGQDQAYPGENADLAMTFEELDAMFRAKNVTLHPTSVKEQNGSIYGKRYANAGGVTRAVKQALIEQEAKAAVNVHQCNGAEECRKGLIRLVMRSAVQL